MFIVIIIIIIIINQSINQSIHELPFNSNLDLSIGVVQRVKPALHQQRPLEAKGCNKEVEAHSSEAVPLKKRHQETEADEDHDVDVLETCRAD